MEDAKSKAESMLNQARLKKTPARIAVLMRFLSVEHAQSYFDLQEAFKGNYDKSTLYRTLGSFEEAELLHRIDDASGISKYAFGKWYDRFGHAHFICDSCHNTYCLNKMEEKTLKVPEGFQSRAVNILINGTCPNC